MSAALVYSTESGVGASEFLESLGGDAWGPCGEDGCSGMLFLPEGEIFAVCDGCGESSMVHCCHSCAYGDELEADEPEEMAR